MRRILIIAGLAVVLIATGVAILLLSQGKDYETVAKERWEAARPKPPSAAAFRATICSASPCVLIEAAGLTFLVGAGEGAAEGLQANGLLRRDMDGVLLEDLGLDSVAGLPALGEAIAVARPEPLPVYGPMGVDTVVDGVNLMLAAKGDDHLRLAIGEEGEDQGPSGQVVYDSGVVTVLAFPTEGGGRVYRIETPQRSVIVAGCTASPQDVVAAARGARAPAGVVGAMNAELVEAERQAAKAAGAAAPANPGCMTVQEAVSAIESARLSAALIVPLAPRSPESLKAWKRSATIPKTMIGAIGLPGSVLDLTGATPEVDPER
jgi:hypothetical protein